MHISSLRVEHFRNLSWREYLDLPPRGGIVLVGPNGCGKTNTLEAVLLAVRGRTHRTLQRPEMIERGTERARLRFTAQGQDQLTHVLEAELTPRRATHCIDGKRLASRLELVKQFPAVSFFPDELTAIKGAPALRRRLLDSAMSWEPGYIATWHRYHTVLKSRQAVLRRAQQHDVLEAYDIQLVESGEDLTGARMEFLQRFGQHFSSAVAQLGLTKPITLALRPGYRSGDLAEELRDSRSRDLVLRTTSRGPHRADLELTIDGLPIRGAASQGEQRLVTLAFKLAQLSYVYEAVHQTPLLLLDDISSELSEQYVERLFAALPAALQYWTSTVGLRHLPRTMIGQARVIELGE